MPNMIQRITREEIIKAIPVGNHSVAIGPVTRMKTAIRARRIAGFVGKTRVSKGCDVAS